MALSLNYPSPYGGDDFTYFIIGEVRENRYHGHATVVVYGFVHEAARLAMANYVPISIVIDAEHWTKDATIAQIYSLLKSKAEFASAQDV